MFRKLAVWVAIPAALFLGAMTGYVYGTLTSLRETEAKDARAAELRTQLEEIHSRLGCSDLAKPEMRGPLKQEEVTFYIHVGEMDYQVIGFRVDSHGPIIDWVGAELPSCKR